MLLPIEDADYFIHVVDFPVPVAAMLRENPEDGTYSVYLNAKRDSLQRIDDYEHELWHMIRGDLEGEKDIKDIEPELRKGA